MIVTSYTPEDLKKLPLRAIVALAARCARRVEQLALLSDVHPEKERCRTAVAGAIRLAEDVANGLRCPSLDHAIRHVESCRSLTDGDFVRDSAMGAVLQAAHAAAAAVRALELSGEPAEKSIAGPPPPNPFPAIANVTADLAAREAFMAALEAVGADGHTDAFIKAAIEDYQKLRRLDLGTYPQAGQPIDPSSQGPLGPE
jgi:hypothetical protein